MASYRQKPCTKVAHRDPAEGCVPDLQKMKKNKYQDRFFSGERHHYLHLVVLTNVLCVFGAVLTNLLCVGTLAALMRFTALIWAQETIPERQHPQGVTGPTENRKYNQRPPVSSERYVPVSLRRHGRENTGTTANQSHLETNHCCCAQRQQYQQQTKLSYFRSTPCAETLDRTPTPE